MVSIGVLALLVLLRFELSAEGLEDIEDSLALTEGTEVVIQFEKSIFEVGHWPIDTPWSTKLIKPPDGLLVGELCHFIMFVSL